MKITTFLTFCLILTFTLVMVGCGKKDDNKQLSQTDMQSFFKKYCDIYVNKYQANDLKSYGIEVTENTGVGYYNDVNECVQAMNKFDKSSEDACQKYGKSSNQDCNKARANRQETYKKQMTKQGCLDNGKNNRCFMWDTTQSRWQGADSQQITDAKAEYTRCLKKVEYACSDLPATW